MDFLPDIRISREITLLVGKASCFLLTLSNNSMVPIRVEMKGERVEGDAGCVDVSAFSLDEFTIPYKDDTADIDEYLHQQGDSGGSGSAGRLTSIRRHNIGVSVECTPEKDITKESYAQFRLRYAFSPTEGQEERWMETGVRVFLMTDQ